MDTQTLINRMQSLIISDYEWEIQFFISKSGRDGVEMDFYKCGMKDISPFVETIRQTMLQKALADRIVTDYTPFLTKENIGVLATDNELIRDSVSDIFLSIYNSANQAPEDYISGVLPYPTGYVFYGTKKNESGEISDKILFFRRTNPFIKPDKNRLCTTAVNDIVTNDKPILKFTPTVDLLIIDDNCCFITTNMVKDLGLESRHYAVCAKRMKLIAEKSLISNYDQMEAAAMTGKNARKFLDFDTEILEYIERLSVSDRADFLDTYGILLDNEGRMDTNDSEQCELIIDLLCCRSCIDVLGRLAVTNGISPRE